MVDLAARAGMTKQSMGYLVDQMQAAGLLEIAPDPHDKRANIVRLTARGEKVVNASIELSRQGEAYLSTLVGEGKIRQLRSILQEIYQHLEEPDQAGKS
ncbi:MarR family winged helix-turn-helix transcriptional regulator [Undibacterium sp. Ji42W]|uniref:MarR family winged helix-turn-helix transcriptional regulator n=1 Tax=Undibacterium sp. Ji42W TaxID=3413039 RepID=UPI003BF43A1C